MSAGYTASHLSKAEIVICGQEPLRMDNSILNTKRIHQRFHFFMYQFSMLFEIRSAGYVVGISQFYILRLVTLFDFSSLLTAIDSYMPMVCHANSTSIRLLFQHLIKLLAAADTEIQRSNRIGDHNIMFVKRLMYSHNSFTLGRQKVPWRIEIDPEAN